MKVALLGLLFCSASNLIAGQNFAESLAEGLFRGIFSGPKTVSNERAVPTFKSKLYVTKNDFDYPYINKEVVLVFNGEEILKTNSSTNGEFMTDKKLTPGNYSLLFSQCSFITVISSNETRREYSYKCKL